MGKHGVERSDSGNQPGRPGAAEGALGGGGGPPTISSVSPVSAPDGSAPNVQINGANFQAAGAGATHVFFGGFEQAIGNVVVVSDIQIDMNADTNAGTGVVDVDVTNDNGTGTLTNGFEWTP